jgi:preprotein translocase subunit SecF
MANNTQDDVQSSFEGNAPQSYHHDEFVIRFMRFRKPLAIVSILIILISIGSILYKGLNLGLDFTGGISAEINYAHPVKQDDVQNALIKAGFHDPVVQYLGTQRDLLVRMPAQTKSTDASTYILKAVQLSDNTATVQKVDVVGSQVGNDLYLHSLGAIGLALALMMIYVAMRFQFKFAVGAVISLLHVTIITVGVFSVLGWPFDLTVLAAVLALIGYSLNDTIVVFDRIRENFRKIRGASAIEIIDISLTETFRRTVMTVATVALVAFAMLFLGGDGLYWFSAALLIGLFVGTYSSIYIATGYAIFMNLSRQDFIVTVKPEFEEDTVVFHDPKAPKVPNKP